MKKTAYKRKKQGKTDYKNRLGLLKSGLARIVIRKTNKYIIVQYIKSKEARDKIIVGVSSKDLLKNGWAKELEGSLKSVPASYLTGYLAGKKILEKSKDASAILDLGLQRNITGSRIYSALKGVIDAGVKINCDKKVFPSEDRIAGKHLKENVQKVIESVKEKIK